MGGNALDSLMTAGAERLNILPRRMKRSQTNPLIFLSLSVQPAAKIFYF
jgi:hypothetical protein